MTHPHPSPAGTAPEAWARAILGTAVTLEPIAGDASTRSYLRVHGAPDGPLVVMVVPGDAEALQRYLEVARRLAAAGVRVPAVRAADPARGLALVEDLGATHYLDVLSPADADGLYGAALDTLLRIQRDASPAGLPPYDEALLRRELAIFRQWYLEVHCERALDPAGAAAWEAACDALVENALVQPRCFVHRDYHSRNLMWRGDGGPGVLDFQDAVHGPVTYDLASLLLDCYVAWPQQRVRHWALGHRDALVAAGLLEPTTDATFMDRLVLMATQRHLKAMGIFARLHHRDGRDGYLKDIPRTAAYVRAAARAHPALGPLERLVGPPAAGRRG